MSEPLKVAVAGLGSIGMRVARALDDGIEGLVLTAVAGRDEAAARQRVESFTRPPAVLSLEALPAEADVVVECLPPQFFALLAAPVLRRTSLVLVVLSAGALLARSEFLEKARANETRIIVPSGAVAGLDGLRAAREAGLRSVKLVTRKPPAAFGSVIETAAGALSSAEITTATMIFSGSAQEAVKAFPRNINIAATVSLAGLGPDRTDVEIWSDPSAGANRHELHVTSVAGALSVSTLNLPDPGNPRTSAITAYSVVSALRRLGEPISVGS